MIYWTTERMFLRLTVLETLWFCTVGILYFFFCYFRLKIYFFKQNRVTLEISQCCLKQKPREANTFHILSLASDWGRTVGFNIFFLLLTCFRNILFLIYALLIFRSSPKEITQYQVLLSKFLMFVKIKMYFCWLNIVLFLIANFSHGHS